MVELSDIPKLKVQDLKNELSALGLLTSGKKAELAARLTEALTPAAEPAQTTESVEVEDASAVVEEAPAATTEDPGPATEAPAPTETAPTDSSTAAFTNEKVFEYLASKADADLSEAEKMILLKKKRA